MRLSGYVIGDPEVRHLIYEHPEEA
jgi:hypothetical protein